jgi:hypothetical protein
VFSLLIVEIKWLYTKTIETIGFDDQVEVNFPPLGDFQHRFPLYLARLKSKNKSACTSFF